MPDGVPGLLRGLSIPATGLSAQRRRVEVISMNLANAGTTRTAEGGPYQRRVLELAEAQSYREGTVDGRPIRRGQVDVPAVPEVGSFHAAVEQAYGVEIVGETVVAGEGPLVYEPGHPDADASGYVQYPNVDLTQERIDLIEATRAYEANATVFDAMKSMLRRALQI